MPRRFRRAQMSLEEGAMRGDVPAVVRGRLADVVGHQRRLIRPDALDQLDEAGVGIALDVELGAGEFRPRPALASSGTSERRICRSSGRG